MNTSLTDTFTTDEINSLYADGATKQSMAPTAFKKLKEVAVKKITNKATLTTDKTDLKTKILMNPFYYMDQHGVSNSYGSRKGHQAALGTSTRFSFVLRKRIRVLY